MDQDDNLNIDTKDVQHAIRIGERVWWVGHYMPDDTFQCHVYLIEHGDHSVLIDPGGYLTFKHVYKKVQEVVPFSNIRYFICQHQDPDITAALRLIDIMPDVRKDAVIVTHWRTMQLIKHYDPALPFWNIDEHNWQLDLGGGRVLKFIFTPYLHFPAAFCTFDTLSGILFSSDIFGGFTANWSLVARDQSHIENIRPFHEHYMPSREILIHGLSKLEEYPIKMIAPQHGSIIPSHLIDFMIDELKQTDCGLYALARDSTNIHRLSFLNKALKDITNVVVTHRDFWDIANELLAILRKTLPVSSAEFYAYTHNHNKECLCLMPETRFRGIITAPPVQYESMSNLNKRSWLSQNKGCYKKMPLPPEHISDVKKAGEHYLLIPLFSPNRDLIQAIAILSLGHDINMTYENEKIVEQISEVLAVAVERECILYVLDMERKKFYEQAIRDPLTGLYNRLYMEETLKPFFHMHDRNGKDGIVAIMSDIDHFKKINDSYGHGAGDKVLKQVASVLIGCIRTSDLAIRYGGEEFAIFLVGQSTRDGVFVAEKIRSKVSQMKFDGMINEHKITLSCGVASRRQKEPFADFIQRADTALYQAKSTSRDKVCCEDAFS